MKKTLGLCTAALVALGLAVAPALGAAADEPPVPDPIVTVEEPTVEEVQVEDVPDEVIRPVETLSRVAPQAEVVAATYVTFAWKMPSWEGDHAASWPQTLWRTESTGTSPNLAALDDDLVEYALTLKCETSEQFQIDGYYESETTTALAAGGHLNGSNNPKEDLIPGGWGTAYKVVQVSGPECPVIEFCETSIEHPTATNLNPDGWVIKPDRGEFVEGGLHLYSTADSSGWAQKALGIPFSEVGDLSTIYEDATDQYTFGVILTLDGPQPDHAFGKQQIHYDSDGRYWTDQEGILGNGAVLKGGYWETYDLEADLVNDVTIVNIVLYVNAGHGGLTILSQGYGCSTQPFDYEPPVIPEVCEVATEYPVSTNLDPQGWTLESGDWVEGGLEFEAADWSDAYAYHAADFPLSAAANLDIDATPGIWAIILETTAGNVHYEPGYTDSLWTNASGILPRNAVNEGDNAGQGGPYSGELEDLLTDPQVTGVYAYFTSGEEATGTLTSVSFNCGVHTFDREELTRATPQAPTFDDTCGVDEDAVNVPEPGEGAGYTYEVDDQRVNGVGTVTVTAIPSEGYAFDQEATTVWSHEFTNEPCPTTTTPPTTPPTKSLATTGLDPETWLAWGAIGALAIVAGLIFMIAHLRRRSERDQ